MSTTNVLIVRSFNQALCLLLASSGEPAMISSTIFLFFLPLAQLIPHQGDQLTGCPNRLCAKANTVPHPYKVFTVPELFFHPWKPAATLTMPRPTQPGIVSERHCFQYGDKEEAGIDVWSSGNSVMCALMAKKTIPVELRTGR